MTTAAEFKAWLLSDAPFKLPHADPRVAAAPSQPVVPHHLGALVGHLDSVCGGTAERHLFLEYLFGNPSAKTLHVRNVNALYFWLFVQADAEGKWRVTNPRARSTAAAVVSAALVDAGQLELKL